MRSYLRLALFFYFKKIEINYEVPLKPDQARLYLGNHQNGLMDPLLIATKRGQFSYFLTRASVFQKAWISKFLQSLLMIPVYRIRDGWDNLSKNKTVFKNCSQLLYDKNAIVLFPEGNHNIKRYVRPLSKGFTRIIAETITDHPQLDIQLVPVGFNYKAPEDFGDHVVLHFGAPLSVEKYVPLAQNSSVLRLKHDVYEALTKLTTHIDCDNYTVTLQKLQSCNADFLNPKVVNQCLADNFNNCQTRSSTSKNRIKSVAKVVLAISLFLPYGIWKFILEPKVKEPEFTATFRFVLVITVVPIFMLLMATVLGLSFGLFYALLYLVSVFLLDLIAVKL